MKPSQYDKAELAARRLGFTPKCWGWDQAVEMLLAGMHPFDVRQCLVGTPMITNHEKSCL